MRAALEQGVSFGKGRALPGPVNVEYVSANPTGPMHVGHGRGAVFAPDGTQIGWAAMSNPSIGLQVGGQGMQMIIVFETQKVLEEFKTNTMAGSASGTAVGGDSGVTGVAKYTNGVIVYVGAQKGLMAGGSVGLQMFKYKSVADANSEYD